MSSFDLAALEKTIETAFDNRDSVTISTKGEIRDAVETSLNLLDGGQARVAVPCPARSRCSACRAMRPIRIWQTMQFAVFCHLLRR